ncbi:HAMP domain-containing histidine kinase, partial [Ruminococcaceae bacterium OttesenSCG-928-I18]|nr:HAMP domain-containing histidine kinase [Ruminococcaceae bacterium OttesenSCG-928-I18]
RSAKELGKGNYDAHFDATGYREIGELSETLKTAAQELRKTETLRQDLVANVSHDLRTPLTLITGYAEMIRDIPGETTRENMQVIIDEANRLSSLVGDLLDLSRLQSGTAELHFERLCLTDEIRSIISRFQKLSATEGTLVRLEAEGEVWVNADAARLSQVVYNFLINAMTHGGADKFILVRQTVSSGRVKVEVTDHGEGIAPEDLPYIWDRYYKVDKTHKRTVVGAGLGLSIVKSILEQHPGVEYGAESALAKGSTFWFSLPVADEDLEGSTLQLPQGDNSP